MRLETVQFLLSPATGARLQAEPFALAGTEILEGRLIDAATGDWYRVEDGIADLTLPQYRNIYRHTAFCKRHGLDQTLPPPGPLKADPNASKQVKFFATYQDGYEADVVQSPFYQVLNRVTIDRWLDEHVKKDALVTEVGCGSGHQTLHIVRQGGNVVGVDLSEDMLRHARRRVRDESCPGYADFVIGTAENLPLADSLFDAAAIFGGLHHFSDPPAALLKLSRALKAGGHVFLLEPHNSPVRFVFDWMMRRWPLWQEEANEAPLFEASQLTEFLNASGIECSIRYSTFLPPHLFYFLKPSFGDVLLSSTDRLLNSVPGLRRCAGVIIAEGTKAYSRVTALASTRT
jgi:SAM-dependent methyltransferase